MPARARCMRSKSELAMQTCSKRLDRGGTLTGGDPQSCWYDAGNRRQLPSREARGQQAHLQDMQPPLNRHPSQARLRHSDGQPRVTERRAAGSDASGQRRTPDLRHAGQDHDAGESALLTAHPSIQCRSALFKTCHHKGLRRHASTANPVVPIKAIPSRGAGDPYPRPALPVAGL